MPPKETVIRNVRFGTVSGPVGGGTQHAIAMDYTLHGGSANLVQRDAVLVEAYDGVAGDDFQVFYHEQRPDFVVPQSSGNLAGSPAAGLTNAQNWATYGIAIAGAVATDATTRPGIDGLVRAGAPPPPPPPPPNQTPVVSAGPNRRVTWPGAATLAGTVEDDGWPDPPGALTVTWKKVRGPGTVSFGDPGAPGTTATFSAPGTYVLELSADDGAASASDRVRVRVLPP
jgi:hypothetical protein